MTAGRYLIYVAGLIGFAYLVFRVVVRRDYRKHGKLRIVASMMQLLAFAALFSFPYLFLPPSWPWFWRLPGTASHAVQSLGAVLISLGFLTAFGTMAWFGIGKAFGYSVSGLTQSGPYRLSRNPQILGGYLLIIGTAIQWFSLYAYGWILLYALIAHWMVITEEEHLQRVFGSAYEAYCAEVPRYIPGPRR